MAKAKSVYSCTECGGQVLKWQGQCPHCQAWNTLVETVAEAAPAGDAASAEAAGPRIAGRVDTRDDVIRAIVELGGTYPDVVQALEEAKKLGALASRLEVDALPEAGRSYDRAPDAESEEPDQSGKPAAEAASAKKVTPHGWRT